MKFAALFLAALATAAPAVAQTHGGHGADTPAHPPSLYSGMETRRIKALSEEQIADLMAGRGMGLALAAELNSYPGPLHVLELAGPLGLTAKQQRRTRQLLESMKAEAIPIGQRVIDGETALDGLFAGRTVTKASLAEATKRIAVAQGELRAAHLRYHLEMARMLTSKQIDHYARLRGYAGKVD
ncbi:MAG: hypothetical protein H0T56_02830 [Pseudaminobacter sp.]|nr:hypothetical protein [Pseudaminobacter sp.]